MFVIGTHRAQQEREYRGYRWLWAGINPTNPTAPAPPRGTVIVGQNYPLDHPQSQLRSGVAPTNPAVTNIFPPGTVIVGQYLPLDHPKSLLWFGLPPVSHIVPPVGSVFIGQNYPLDHPRSLFWPGRQGPNVASPDKINRALIVGQNYPLDHPQSLLVFAAKYTAPFANDQPIISKQERPFHPGSFFFPAHNTVAYEERHFFIIA